MNSVSDEFYEAFHSGVASHCVTCGCGITHFSEGGCWALSEEEYNQTLANSQANPDKYNMMAYNEAASLIDLGVEYVLGCPCKTVERYEAWLWKHKEQIVKYLKSRGVKELKAAEENLNYLTGLTKL